MNDAAWLLAQNNDRSSPIMDDNSFMSPTAIPLPELVELPFGLMADAPWFNSVGPTTTLRLCVPEDYEVQLKAVDSASEVLGIQRLLTIARRGARLEVAWDSDLAAKVVAGPAIFPLLAVLLMLRNANHSATVADGQPKVRFDLAQRETFKHRFGRDLFADVDMVLCTDGASGAWPEDLYDRAAMRLLPREHFETLVLEAIAPHLSGGSASQSVYKNANLLGIIVAELFENTDMHGKYGIDGKPLGPESMRGLIFKRVKLQLPVVRPRRGEPLTRAIDCFEASVFDAGIGYFASYTRRHADAQTTLDEEWKVLHNCLERHYYPELPDSRPGHRGLGLYEVLRALQVLKGRIEIRTGRLFAYRTFLAGELQAQMEDRAPYAHLAWPVPKLLDAEKKFFAKPSEHEPLVGSSVRIIVPLA